MATTGAIVMKSSDRSQVLVLGDNPVDEEPFVQRKLSRTLVTREQLGDNTITNNACGVLLAPFPGKFGLVQLFFEKDFFRICQLGLKTAVYVTEKKPQIIEIRNSTYVRLKVYEEIADFAKRLEKFDLLEWVYLGEELWTIAETFARHNPGPELGNPAIDMGSMPFPLDLDTETILKRAFSDCDRITIERLMGGKTAKETFRVFANLAGPESGPQPMPFFVKVGSSETIAEEKANYRFLADPFIPFYLRPSLNEKRSVRTLINSALVCNFVESAISLRDSLRTGQGDCAIFSLFEITLRGLRAHTLKAAKKKGVLDSFFDPNNGRIKVREIGENYPARIARLNKFKKVRHPELVYEALRKCAARVETREGVYHGDLHAGNIMVRNRDAIVIDFGSMNYFGPLSADPSLLEVSLVFGTDDYDDPNSYIIWRRFVDYIFADPLIPPLPRGDYHQFGWLHKAIRELRHVVSCCGVEREEAMLILGGYLLRFGRLAPRELKSKKLMELAEKRSVYALVVADQISKKLEERHATR